MKLLASGGQASAGAGSPSVPRTMAQPDFRDDEERLDVLKEKTPLAALSREEFEAQVVWLGVKAEQQH